MKTPREAFKENFWIGAKGGLLDVKHIDRMGTSVWLFLYLLREQTSLNQRGEGVVNYGHPLRFQEIGTDLKGVPAETIRVWASTLRRELYIRTESHGHSGLTFWIAKGKAKTRKVKVTHEEARSMHQSARNLRHSPRGNSNGEEIAPRDIPNGESTHPRGEFNGEREPKSPQVVAIEFVADACDSPTPKDFTSENLSYYNKDGALKNRAPHTSVSTDEKLRQRQTLLAKQKEDILRKFAATGPMAGKLTAFRKEAMA